MKKMLVAALGCFAMLGAVSCSGDAKQSKEYTPEQKAFGDSVAVALGHFAGSDQLANFNRMLESLPEEERGNFSKAEFIKGLELVLNTDTAKMDYLNGIYFGFNLYQAMMYTTEQTDCPVEPAKIIAAFKEVYMQDTISYNAQFNYRQEYQNINMKTREKAQAKQQAEQAEKIAANGKAGEEYIATLSEQGYQSTESGLWYKINNPGADKKVGESDKIAIKYVGKHINGEEFDKSETPYECQPSNFIPGFKEGLQLIGKGGSITLVIPGKIGYGDTGSAPRIEPNETLIFEVSIEADK